MATINLSPSDNIQNVIDNVANPGDIIQLAAGVFKQVVFIDKDNITLRGTVDGMGVPISIISGDNFTLPNVSNATTCGDPELGGTCSSFDPMVKIEASNVIVENLLVTESIGRGINIHTHDGTPSNSIRLQSPTIKNCIVHNCRNSGINVQYANNALIEDCQIYDTVNFAPYSRAATETNWPHACNSKWSDGMVWRRCEIHSNWGEGIGIGRSTKNGVIEDCVIHDNYALQVYVHRTTDAIVRRNFIYHAGVDYLRGGDPSSGIVLNNEDNFPDDPENDNIKIYNNIVVGCEHLIAFWGGGGNPKIGSHNVDVFNNTLVSPASTNNTATGLNVSNSPVTNVVVRNNIFYVSETGNNTQVNSHATGQPGLSFDHNCFLSTPVSYAQGAGDVIADPQLNSTAIPATIGGGDATDYFQTSDSPSINQGTNEAIVTTDIQQASRSDGNNDMGAHEYNGVSAPNADFLGNPLSGVGSVTVDLTDLSVAPGDSVNQWHWYKNGGSGWVLFSTARHPAAIVFGVGSWDIRLDIGTAGGNSDSITKSEYISVLESPPAVVSGDFLCDVVAEAIPSSASNQTYTFDLGGAIPKAWKIELTKADALNTEHNHALLSIGFGDGTNEVAGAIYMSNNSNPSEVARLWVDDGVALLIDKAGNILSKATFVSAAANELVLNWSGSPTGELVKITAFAGDGYAAQVGVATLGNSGVAVSVDTPDVQPTIIDLASIWEAVDTVDTDWATLSIGVIVQNTGGLFQASTERSQAGDLSPTELRGRILYNGALWRRSLGGSGQLTVNGVIGSDEFALTPSANANVPVFYLAHQVPGGVWGGVVDSPTSSTAEDYSVSFQPTLVYGQLTMLDTDESVFDDRAGAFGLFSYHNSTTLTSVINSQDNVVSSNEGSIVADSAYLADDSDGTLFDVAVSILEDGFRFSAAVTDATARKWIVVAIEQQEELSPVPLEYDLSYWNYSSWPHAYWFPHYFPKVEEQIIAVPPQPANPGHGLRLGIQFRSTAYGDVLADWSHTAVITQEPSTNEHGFEAFGVFVPLPLHEAAMFYDLAINKWLTVSYGAGRVYEGRVEDRKLVDGGIELVALGAWRALSDLPYTALWSNTLTQKFEPIGAFSEARASLGGSISAVNWRYELNNNNRVYIAPKAEEHLPFNAAAYYLYQNIDEAHRPIVRFKADYVFEAPAGWEVGFSRRESDLGFLEEVALLEGDGTEQTGSIDVTFAGCDALTVEMRNQGAATNFGPDATGDWYVSLTNIRIQTAADDAITADLIANDLVSYVNNINPDSIDSSSVLIESPNLDLENELYEDVYGADILKRLIALGDDQTPPRRWEAAVWDKLRLTFRPLTTGFDWYIDLEDLRIESSLDTLYNQVYAKFGSERTAVANDEHSQIVHNLKRGKQIAVTTESESQAEVHRDAALEDTKSETPRASVTVSRVYDQYGNLYFPWLIRAGDTLTIRNLQPTLSPDIDRVRKFRIIRTQPQLATNQMICTPERELPSLEFLLARKNEGV